MGLHDLECIYLICLVTELHDCKECIYLIFLVTGLHDLDEYIQAQLLLAVRKQCKH